MFVNTRIFSMKSYTQDTYLSVFTTRYGTKDMQGLFSDLMTRKLWRKTWVALATVQQRYGLVSTEELADIVAHQDAIDLERALEIEEEIQHDVMAEIRTYAEQCSVGGGKIHLGATSMDIRDNAEVLQLKYAVEFIEKQLITVLQRLIPLIEQHKKTVCIGLTHLQTAEPITVGFRIANWAQDFLEDLFAVRNMIATIRAKGFKGAVGTAASYATLLDPKGISVETFEQEILAELGLQAWPLATQVYPRKQDYSLLTTLASIAQSASKLAFDIRILQSPFIGEMSEPFGKKQVGSSAMPFKRNPIITERVCSLGRILQANTAVVWQNASNNLFERTLDDSANRRVVLAESFLATSEILRLLSERILNGLVTNGIRIKANFTKFGVFAGTETLLMKLAERGVDRQEGHEIIRELSLKAWAEVEQEKQNPLIDLLSNHPTVAQFFSRDEVTTMLDAQHHIGNAVEKCDAFLALCKKSIF